VNRLDALKSIRCVLTRTTHPGNIGGAARALKTMGLESLYLVAPREFPSADADARAAGAADLLRNASVCASLEEALTGTTFAIGCTARRRELSHPVVDARHAAVELLDAARGGEVALVFGPEASGLTNAELGACQRLATIDADPAYGSLNLACAVQVFAYEIRMALELPAARAESAGAPATHEQLEAFYRHFEEVALAIGYLDAERPGLMMQRIRRLFARARPEREEINLLRGMLKSAASVRARK